jgi:glycosyltransferase involved in cell wall biosynthesis
MKIRWHGMLGTQHSWAFTQQALIDAMAKIGGHDIYLKSTNNLEHFPEHLKKFLLPGYHGHVVQGDAQYLDGQGNEITINKEQPAPEIKDDNRPYDLELAYTIPYQGPRRFFPESKCRAIIWNFESSILPPGWHLYSRSLDYVLPSSQYSYDIFAQNGVPEEKLVVVPHGVDLSIFNPNIPPFELKTTKKVKFLHNAIPHHRKLHERVIKGFVETFTGDDDVCLVLKTKFVEPAKDKPFEVDVKSILEEAFAGKKNPPEVEVVNRFIPDMGSLYTACDVVVSMSAAEGFCLLPSTPIDVPGANYTIENAQPGDYITTHTGEKKVINNVTTRYIDEEIVYIRRHGSDIEFGGTKTHPHLIVKRDGRKFSALRKLLKKNALVAKWIGLGDIEKGDLVVIPKPVKNGYINTYDLSQFVDSFEEDGDGKIWLKNSFRKNSGNSSVMQVAEHVGCSYQHVSRVLNSSVDTNTPLSNRIRKGALELGYVRPEPAKLDRFLELNSELAKFLGLYIAEGSVSSGGNSFNINLHIDEKYGQRIATNFCEKLSIPYCEIKNGLKYQLSGSSKIVASFLSSKLGSGATTKKIPLELYNSPFINDVLHGIFYGDGTVTNDRYAFSTSSSQLRNDIFSILLANNIFSNISTDKRGDVFNNIITIASSYNKTFFDFINPIKYQKAVEVKNGNRNDAIIEAETCFLVPIKKIRYEKYTGDVYNLEIEENKSFCSLGMATHNCLPLLEALACESLIIAPRHGGQLDFLNDENSLLVDTGEMEAPASMQYWGHMKGAVVGDPNIEHYKELLRHAYKNLDDEKARIKKPAQETAEFFTWERAAQMILDLPIPEKSFRIPDKRKVLYIVPYKMVGGGEVWVKQAIAQLDTTVYEPHVALISGTDEKFKQSLIDLGANIEDLSGPVGRDRALKCLIESENYSIIHFYNSFGVYRVLQEVWNQGFRCRIVETVHSELGWQDSMTKVATRGPHITVISAVSNRMARKLLKMGNKNVAVLPQQIDWDRFNVPRSKEILDELNICGDFIVGFVGRLSPEKNIPAILQCAKMLPDVSFVIVGDGPQKQPLEQMARDLKNVYFTGARSDVEKFYAAFDLLVLPSVMEGMPLVILEAMSAGTPVVASDVGAILEVVFDGITGSLVWNPGNPGLFVKEIQKFKNNKQLWTRCSANCKAVADASRDKVVGFNINHLYNLLFQKPGE